MIPCCPLQFRFFSTLTSTPPTFSESQIVKCTRKIQELSKLGRLGEARVLFDSMPQRNAVTWNSMIAGYAENGILREARKLFDSCQGKNVRTWTTLLTGYAKHGFVHEAWVLFNLMPERNTVSWNAMMSGFLRNGYLMNARALFDQMPHRNLSTWNSIITGYCNRGMITEARELFDSMVERNYVSWMAMISGHDKIGQYVEAWNVFLLMIRSGVKPEQSIFVVTISAMTGLDNFQFFETVRSMIMKTGYESDVVVGSAILNAYTRIGSLEDAVEFFNMMPERNEYTWSTIIASFAKSGRLDDAIALYERYSEKDTATQTTMITAYAERGMIREARLVFDQIPIPNQVSWNAMISSYAQNGMLDEAKNLFLTMPARNAASWAALISGFVQNGQSRQALELFCELHRSGILPNHSSFSSSLFACAEIGDIEIGKQIHTVAIKRGGNLNLYIGNGLISMYAKCKYINEFSRAFEKMKVRDVVSWNSLLSGLSENHLIVDARRTFENMPERDVVSWSCIISAYEQVGQGDVAFELFLNMLALGLKPNQSTVASLLSACGFMGTAKLGQQIHALTHKIGLDACLYVCNALISMYFKCGNVDGFRIFQEVPKKDIVTWNTVLSGCAQNGLGEKAVEIFRRIQTTGMWPDEITFLGVLCACSHAGLMEKGWEYFSSMSKDYGIMPSVHHYTCMVDLLGRKGQLSEAEALINNMTVEADMVIWESLLCACRVHHNIELGQSITERLVQMGSTRIETYVLLSNIYASRGQWEKVLEAREIMKIKGINKEHSMSWIQMKNRTHYFLMGYHAHDEIGQVNSTLNYLVGEFRKVGYVPNANLVLHDVEEELKPDELLYHSEKLALAYAILQTSDGTPIQYMKNARICCDCHTFLKFASNVCHRKITVREVNRLHHFQDGSCSCGDYW